MNTTALFADKAGPAAHSSRRSGAYLFSPFLDFLSFGGSSLVLLPLVFLKPADDYRGLLALLMIVLANLINHPHFAHSYQIFYRGFIYKLTDAARPVGLRARYAFAGVAAPLILIIYFTMMISTGNREGLGYAANIMAFFVGWHYVKQGYGMLMVDCALKRTFFTAAEKRVFLCNGYAIWVLAWINLNAVMKQQNYFGIPFSTFAIPDALHTLAAASAIFFTAATLIVFARRLATKGSLPVNGVVGYLVSLYAWTLFVKIEPLWILVVPALHSLQYLAVVYRFETNYRCEKDVLASTSPVQEHTSESGRGKARGLIVFGVTGLVLGATGFWILPGLLNQFTSYDRSLFGAHLYLFVFWIFINVHHYFIDNVIWRRDNFEVQRFLFGAGSR